MYLWRRRYSAVTALFLTCTSLLFAQPKEPPARFPGADYRVGIDEGDIRGNDNRALQAAVDYVAGLGGGTVHIGPGRYQMRNALVLRDKVRIVGVPGKTVLVASDGFSTPLAADGDCNQREIIVTEPAGFRVGDGVAIADSRSAGGFDVTTATITARLDDKTFRISGPLRADYMVFRKASARLAFPLVGGWQVKNAAVEGLTLDGNRASSQPLDGCRGGGIYLFESADVVIRNCTVSDYNGDGISFQVSQRVTVEDCVVKNNAGHGLHPGSGSQHPVVRRNHSTGNGQDGLFVCWRVQHGVFEKNELPANKRFGICIGHKDSDNLFRDNVVVSNKSAGIFFRNETEAMGAHRNVFENNRILDNGQSGSTLAAIVIRGYHHNLLFRGNTIGNTKAVGTPSVGLLISTFSRDTDAKNNKFLNVDREIDTQK
jgi:parallel beta-helix repeat protein